MRRRDLLVGFGSVALTPALLRARSARAEATPGATPASGEDISAFAEILALAPDVLAGSAPPLNQIAVYANPALQLATYGIPVEGVTARDWLAASSWLVFPSGIAESAREPVWRATFGFDAFQIDLALEVGEPPDRIRLLRGRFDPAELRAAWTTSAFSPVDLPGAEAYSWAEDGSLDPDSAVSRLALGAMNNAAILGDGTVVFAPTLTQLRATVAAAIGDGPSLGGCPEVADFVAALDPTWITAYLLTPEAIRAPDPATLLGGGATDEQVAAVATQIARGSAAQAAMPRPDLVAIGITAGGPFPPSILDRDATPVPLPDGTPLATGEIALRYPNRAAAESAAAIIDARLRDASSLVANVPYQELFPTWEIRIAPGSPTVVVRLEPDPAAERAPNRVFDLLLQRDLLFVAWHD